MKIWLALFAILPLAVPSRADDLTDRYNQLKDADAKKDADAVKTLAAQVHKLAQAAEAAPKPADASEQATWKQTQDYAKQLDVYSEYALSTTAIASTTPAKTVDLVNELIQQNPKSQYLGSCARAYLDALRKVSPAKEASGAEAILAANPSSEDALYALATANMSTRPAEAGRYASRLVTVMKTKGKPEGVSEAEWEKTKSVYLGQGYYIAGAAACTAKSWSDCDKNLREAIPLVGKEQNVLGPLYFYLGLANYQLAKVTDDRVRMEQAQKYSQQSAAIPGPMQGQAQTNASAIQQELTGRRR